MGVRGDDRTQRVLLGIGLAVLGLFLALSLVPLGRFGEGLKGLFPSGNIVGPFGAFVAGALLAAFGISVLLIPASALLAALWSLEKLEAPRAVRAQILIIAVLILLPALVASIALPLGGAPAPLVGYFGSWTADAVTAALGWLGSALMLAALLIACLIGTYGLAPLRRARRALGRMWGSTRSAGLVSAAAIVALGRRMFVRPRRRSFAWARSEPQSAVESPLSEAETPAEPASQARPRKKSPLSAILPDPGDPDATELPPLKLLTPAPRHVQSVSEGALDELGEVLINKLRTFRVEGEIGGRTTGPVVTQFEVIPASGVKVGRIAALADDLALALKAPSVRIIAPIPGKGAVGVEVPNPERRTVILRQILESRSFQDSRAQLPVVLGEDVTGQPYVADLAKMPHLLIAGVTGSGKSVCINSIITSLIYRHTPESLRLLMVDPKMVELAGYNVLPHLRHSVVTDNSDAATVLKWLVYEMERRYAWLSANRCRNITEFNRRVARGEPINPPGTDLLETIAEPERLPYIVLIIDELADLMMTVQAEVERPLAFLAQKARATGIHLVVATQRPSVNVITGLIKANFPCRIAFRVASKVDSRTIIDQNGADSLLGNGDMLFLLPGTSEPIRLQGTYLATEDTERLMDWYRARAEAAKERAEAAEEDILESVRQRELDESEKSAGGATLADVDSLFRQAAEIVIQHQQGSTSLLQRRLKVGYGRAARIVDQLESAGIVGPPEGSKPRQILVTLEEMDHITRAEGKQR